MDHSLDRTQRTREAVLLLFCEPEPAQCSLLQHLSASEWKRLLHWLDTSGLALYFLDRITQLGRSEVLPPTVLSRLQQNLADNTQRTLGMMAEMMAIHKSFRDAGLSYVMLKGFSLCPHSVPKLELRSQLDIDFLMAEECAPAASVILRARSYDLNAISGRSWEFKSGNASEYSIKDLYSDVPQRSVELHLESSNASPHSLLAHPETLSLQKASIPVLSSVDLLLGQGLHLYKHVCSPCARAAHHIEFRRHVLTHFHDAAFWQRLRQRAEATPAAAVKLGLVTLLISHVMGDFAPPAFTCWTVDCLPIEARLWVELYGRRFVLDGFPGSKLYLLLQQAMEQTGIPSKRSLRQVLLPLRLPPAISHGPAGETLPMQARRYRKRVHHISSRLYFHLVEGLRYLYESTRWKRQLDVCDERAIRDKLGQNRI